MDVDTVEPGIDFVEELQRTVESCDFFLAVLGTEWLAAKDEDGQHRLSNPDDFVVLEIGSALKRSNIRVVPILVGGARMPRSTELPERLSPLTRRQALILPDIGFQQSLGRLIQSIERVEQQRLAQEKAEADKKAAAAEAVRQKKQRQSAAAKALREKEKRESAAAQALREKERREAAAYRALLEKKKREAAAAKALSPEERREAAAAKALREKKKRQSAAADRVLAEIRASRKRRRREARGW
jgi:hypothetical protein